MAILLRAAVVVLAVANVAQAYLEVRGDGLYHKGQKVFLSGTNYAWDGYGWDFGDNNYFNNHRDTYERWLQEISAAGGNSVRFWLHVEGYTTPAFDGDGFVTGGDKEGTLGDELKAFLDAAADNDVFIIPVLWNGAYLTNQQAINLVWDDSKLDTYIENALKPLVRAVSNHPALAAWEIVNEPEGSIRPGESNGNPCFDTTVIGNSGAGWTGVNIPMERYLRFINKQIAAIKSVDSNAIATQGSWNEKSQSNICGDCRNYYTDSCLIAAGGENSGTLDFYQMHTYSWNGQYSQYSPMKKSAGEYGLDKPVVIGEFAAECSEGTGIESLFQHAYTQGYAGAWSWQWNAGGDCADDASYQGQGMSHIAGMQNSGNGMIDVSID